MRRKFNRERILRLCKPGDYGIMSPPMDAQIALNEIADYLLGDWYSTSGATHVEQINTEIVCEIEKRFPGAVIRPKDRDQYNRECGKLMLYELPVGTAFKLGKYRMRKVQDYFVTKAGPKEINCVNLANGHNMSIVSSVWVIPIKEEESNG